jgi:hypothetical protein
VPTSAQILTLHNHLMTFYGTHILSQCPPPTSLDTGQYTPLDGTSGAVVLGGPGVGTGGGDSLPAEVALVLTIRTAARGRQNRGRVFLPAMGESTSSSLGHLQPGVLSDILAGAVELETSLLADGWELGVASYGVTRRINHTTHPKTFTTTTWDPHFTTMLTISCDGVFDVIRNRKA